MRHDLVADADRDAARAGQRSNGILRELADHIMLAFRGIAELNVDGDFCLRRAHAFHRLARDEILSGIGIDDAFESGGDISVRQRHRQLRKERVTRKIQTILSEPM